MPRFLARRHQRLMDESEHALRKACRSNSERRSRISKQILNDSKIHSIWESRHANLLVPVAEQNKPHPQVILLRQMATRMVHGRAIIEYIRDKALRGDERRRFFAHYYPQLDYQEAILSSHRHYMLSVSSMLSTNHLIDVMFDPVSHRLLDQYQQVYKQYFELNSFMAMDDDDLCARAITPMKQGAQIQLNQIREKLETVAPHSRCAEFERQARLARSGRYPVMNYLEV